MNGNLNALLYDCKRIGRFAEEVERGISLLEVFASEQHHHDLKQTHPNIEDVEKYIFRRHARVIIENLQRAIEILTNDIAVLPRDVTFPKAIDMYNEFRKETKK